MDCSLIEKKNNKVRKKNNYFLIHVINALFTGGKIYMDAIKVQKI